MGNAKVLASLYEAFGRGDLPTVLGKMDPKIRWHEAESNPYQPNGEAWIGPDAVVNNLFAKLGEDWTTFVVKPNHFHDAGDVVTVEGRYVGKHGTSGKSLDCQFCHVWSFANGKITKFQQYADTAQLQDAMGVPSR